MNASPTKPGGIEPLASSTETPSKPIFDDADFKKRLIDEYKILQDKMDKIGGFRFTIKGWSVTAVIAASAAGSTASLLTVTMIGIGLAFMLCFFFLFEFQQVKLSRIFGDRARKLEASFRLIDRSNGKMTGAPISVPYMAHEIALASYQQRLLRERPSRGSRRENRLWKRWVDRWPVVKQADVYFYLALILLSFLLPLVPRYRVISTHWNQWTSKINQPSPTTARPVYPTTDVPE